MKKIFLLTFFVVFFLFSKPAFADGGWLINSFHSDISIQKTGRVDVTEKILVDFESTPKHGIFRTIPYVYSSDSGKVYTNVEVISVLRDSQNEKYQIAQNDSNLEIKIGDTGKTIVGQHTYVINYSVVGILKGFSEFDELYWNVSGNNWGVPINNVSAAVTLPESIITATTCYFGDYGAGLQCQQQYSNSTAKFTAQGLQPYQGLTVVVDYKKGVIPLLVGTRPPTFFERIATIGNIFIFLLPIGLIVLFVIIKWYKSGRDIRDGKFGETVVVEYTPPENLRPAVLGVLMDERADTLDVTATIIDLAAGGWLKIKEIPKKWLFGKVDYMLTSTEKNKNGLLPYEKLLLDLLFTTNEIQVSKLKNTFYDDLKLVKAKLYEEVVNKKLFPKNPESSRRSYFALSIIFGFICLFSIFWVPVFEARIFLTGCVVGTIIILLFAKSMGRRTAYGHELYRRSKGYYEFISHVEKYRQPFFEKKNMINEVLPYAIIFGLTAKFANAMKEMGVKTESPSWYSGTGTFNYYVFASNMGAFSSSLSTAIASAPSSSGSGGGGFSGGGFGGGGGGSW